MHRMLSGCWNLADFQVIPLIRKFRLVLTTGTAKLATSTTSSQSKEYSLHTVYIGDEKDALGKKTGNLIDF